MLIALLLSLYAHAAEGLISPGGVPCHEEIAKFCAGMTELREIDPCMMKHESEAGESCRAYIQKKKASPLADDLMGKSGRGIPGLGGGRPALSYSGWYTPSTPSIQYHQARAGFAVSRGEHDSVSMSVGGNSTTYGAGVMLSNGVNVPRQFYAADVGAQFLHRADDGHTFNIGAQIGKASDQPLKDKAVVGANISYSLPDPPHSRWIFSLYYSNNSTFLSGLPIPGVSYMYLTENFVGIFGFPFLSVRWRPEAPWTLSAALFGSNFTAEAAYGDRRKLEGFVEFRSQRYSYMRYARTNPDDRLILQDKRLSSGLRFPLMGSLETELEGGYAYGRTLIETDKESFHIDSNAPQVGFGNCWFAAWNFRLPLY